MMRKIMLILILGVLFPAVFGERVLELDFLLNKNGTASLEQSRTFFGKSDIGLPYSDYLLHIFGEGPERKLGMYLPAYFVILDPLAEVEEIPVSVQVPYQSDYALIRIYHTGDLIYERDISSLCQVNGRCNENENYASCPLDCPSGSSDGLCDRQLDTWCDPDCLGTDSDCQSYDYTFFFAITMGALLLFVSILYWHRRRKKNIFTRE